MTDYTFESCFDYAFFYSKFTNLPPFIHSLKPAVVFITQTTLWTELIRIICYIVVENEFSFDSIFLLTGFSYVLFAKVLSFLFQKRSFDKYVKQIDNFLMSNKLNPVNGKVNYFIEIWTNHKPNHFFKWFLSWFISLASIWLMIPVYKLLTDPDGLVRPPYPFYSPFFSTSYYLKWFYTIWDIFSLFIACFQTVHYELVLTSLLKFHISQFVYLKELIDEISRDSKLQTDGVLNWWIRNHQESLRLLKDMIILMEAPTAVNSLFQMGLLVFRVLTVTTTDHVNQLVTQKLVEAATVIELLCLLAWACHLSENLTEIQSVLIDEMNKAEIIYYGDKKLSHFLKMAMLPCQKPICVSGYGFFTLSNKNYKDLIVGLLSFYTSLKAIRKNQILENF